jgi:hypothetical protein
LQRGHYIVKHAYRLAEACPPALILYAKHICTFATQNTRLYARCAQVYNFGLPARTRNPIIRGLAASFCQPALIRAGGKYNVHIVSLLRQNHILLTTPASIKRHHEARRFGRGRIKRKEITQNTQKKDLKDAERAKENFSSAPSALFAFFRVFCVISFYLIVRFKKFAVAMR